MRQASIDQREDTSHNAQTSFSCCGDGGPRCQPWPTTPTSFLTGEYAIAALTLRERTAEKSRPAGVPNDELHIGTEERSYAIASSSNGLAKGPPPPGDGGDQVSKLRGSLGAQMDEASVCVGARGLAVNADGKCEGMSELVMAGDVLGGCERW
jgi:hypothetical protein